MKNSNGIKKLSLALLLLAPSMTFAALGGVRDLIQQSGGVLAGVIPVIFGLAMVYFFWGMSQFILSAGDVKKLEDGKQKMIWGVVALFVMFSIWGILTWIGGVFGVNCASSGAGGTSNCNIIVPTAP